MCGNVMQNKQSANDEFHGNKQRKNRKRKKGQFYVNVCFILSYFDRWKQKKQWKLTHMQSKRVAFALNYTWIILCCNKKQERRTYFFKQSSRALIAKRTISANTGITTQSFGFVLMVTAAVGVDVVDIFVGPATLAIDVDDDVVVVVANVDDTDFFLSK